MKNLLNFNLAILILFLSSNSFAKVSEIKNNIKNSYTNSINSKINQATAAASEKIGALVLDNFENVKYLDLNIDLQERYKPTFQIMSVNEIRKIESGTVFNQLSFNNHDGDQTINIGIGGRKLFHDNTVLLGSNIFYDHQFTDSHKRSGAGVEAISSVFDVRGNYYNAISGSRNTDEGSERALDGWDLGLELHLHGKHNVNAFATLFEFKNPDDNSTFKDEGNKLGVNATFGHFVAEVGYLNDNQLNDSFFANIKFVVNVGDKDKTKKSPELFQYVDVSDKLYQPVKRENKIRVVKISASGVVASGF